MIAEQACFICEKILTFPFILCCECNVASYGQDVLLCVFCVASLREKSPHKHHHKYTFSRCDFPLFKVSWSGADELRLLNAIEQFGLGNWDDVAKHVKKSPKECKQHYSQFFVNGQRYGMPEWREIPDQFSSIQPVNVTAHRYLSRTLNEDEFCGYMSARGDFTIEYDNTAELVVDDVMITDHDDELTREAQAAVIDIYRHRVHKRESVKRIVRRYGLINLTASDSYFRRLSMTLPLTLVHTLRKLMRLLEPTEFNKYILMLKYIRDLKNDITSLHHYRSNGITDHRQIKIYERLKTSRKRMLSKRTALSEASRNLEGQEAWSKWVQSKSLNDKLSKGASLPHPLLSRRPAPPIDLTGMEGAEKLDTDEWELCSTARLTPTAYSDFSCLLINECKKDGFLRLAKARTVIKIDVNKTRKLYDFLLKRGEINKEPVKS